MAGNNFAPEYVDVATRLVEFREKHPSGSLQPVDLASPYQIINVGGDDFVVVVAAAYRTAEDTRPGVGMAYEPYPGKTPYTRGSELQNAETSAWGRAIMAALAADSRKGISSADEVRNRRADHESEPPPVHPLAALRREVHAAGEARGWSVSDINDDFAAWSQGSSIPAADAATLTRYVHHLREAVTS